MGIPIVKEKNEQANLNRLTAESSSFRRASSLPILKDGREKGLSGKTTI